MIIIYFNIIINCFVSITPTLVGRLVTSFWYNYTCIWYIIYYISISLYLVPILNVTI